MKKLLMISTGGTIGSVMTDGVIATQTATRLQLIEAYEARFGREVAIESLTLFNKLSETFTPADWEALIAAILRCETKDFDGIIVTHGTDTLAYTAIALSYFFHHAPLPIVLVSSLAPLDAQESNALDNLHAAVELCRQKIATGVYVAYKNPHEPFTTIFYGARMTQSPALGSRFLDIDIPFATFKNGLFTIQNCINVKPPVKTLKNHFNPRILYIKPFPGISYNHYSLEGYDAVLHDLYHSGTCDAQALQPLIEQAQDRNIMLCLAPIKSSPTVYETTFWLQQQGVTFLFDMSIEASLVKLALALGQTDDIEEIKTFLKTPLSFEILDNKN